MRIDLLNAVNSRYESLVQEDLFRAATFTDCNFEIYAFEKDKHTEIRRLVKKYLLIQSSSSSFKLIENTSKELKRNKNYILCDEENSDDNCDDMDNIISEYLFFLRSIK